MRIPEIRSKGLNTTGLTGIVLMVLHLTNMINGWWWIPLYIALILRTYCLKTSHIQQS